MQDALDQIRQIARSRHPLGSVEANSVEEYLVGAIDKQGVVPQIQTGLVAISSGGNATVGCVKNILAVLPGKTNGETILFVAHYDSVPASFGAADDGAGVAILLELLRELRNGPSMRNTVAFLFTDGEERGLLGARFFVEHSPEASRVSALINFDSRGSGGVPIMFETGPGSDALLHGMRKAGAVVMANSTFVEVYRRMPNATDFSILKSLRKPGLNLAFAGDWRTYHSGLDTVERLSHVTLEDEGENALRLAQYLGNAQIGTESNAKEFYFTLGNSILVFYSIWTARVILVACVCIVVMLIWTIIRRSGFQLGRMFLSVVVVPAVLLASAATGWLLTWVCSLACRDTLSEHFGALMVAYIAATAGITITALWWSQGNLGADLTRLGIIIWWLGVSLATCVRWPYAASLTLFPCFIAICGAFVSGRLESPAAVRSLVIVAALVVALTGVLLWPGYYIACLALGPTHLAYLLLPLLAFALALCLSCTELHCRTLNVITLTGCLVCIMVVIAYNVIQGSESSTSSDVHGLTYLVNGDHHIACLSVPRLVPRWLAPVFVGKPEFEAAPACGPKWYISHFNSSLSIYVPPVVPSVSLEYEESRRGVKERNVQLSVESPRGAHEILVRVSMEHSFGPVWVTYEGVDQAAQSIRVPVIKGTHDLTLDLLGVQDGGASIQLAINPLDVGHTAVTAIDESYQIPARIVGISPEIVRSARGNGYMTVTIRSQTI